MAGVSAHENLGYSTSKFFKRVFFAETYMYSHTFLVVCEEKWEYMNEWYLLIGMI